MTAPILTRPPRWWTGAACRDADPALFFSTGSRQLAKALAYCDRCPVRADCYRDAVDRREEHGVWGGILFPVRPGRKART